MDAGRRNLLKAGAVTATVVSGVTAAAPTAAGSPAAAGGGSLGFPAKEEFPGIQGTYLNSASVHPLSRGASQAMAKYAEGKLQGKGSRTPIVSFAYKEAAKLAPRLKDAGVSITLSGNRFRISPSVFNDMNDVDRLLGALGAA
jgi:selenocysteine lyase/cysteine desulfurase